MNILDENIPEGQRSLQKIKRIAFRQIGPEIGRWGMKDEEVIPLLHQLNRPTFFTLDIDFFERRLCHKKYCLVFLDVIETFSANMIRRFLRHPSFNTRAKRMGRVARVLPTGITVWRIHEVQESHFTWK